MKRKNILMPLLVVIYHVSVAQPSSPRQLYGDLFVAIQMQSVFPDQKTFVDCTPKEDPQRIVDEYHALQNQPDFDLKKFVADHFNLPADQNLHYKSTIDSGVIHHINELWSVLRHQPDIQPTNHWSLLPLPYAYIIPGGRFREIYYWDSYFSMLGLLESGDTALIENMVRNFSYLIEQYGFMPNGNRTYYLTRSQPPFFSLMVDLLAQLKGKYIYAVYLPSLLKEYNFWMLGADKILPGTAGKNVVNIDGSILNRYWDDSNEPREESYKEDVEAAAKSKQQPGEFYRNVRAAAESGWDFSSRWFADGKNLSTIQTTSIIPVDLNCLLYHLEKTIDSAYKINGDSVMASAYEVKAAKRKKAILKYCWNNSTGFFSDFNFTEDRTSDDVTLAGMFPLFFNVATKDEALSVQKVIEEKLMKEGGVVTTVKNTGQQWDAPNGWAPLEYITVEGLDQYGYHKLAREIAMRWIHLNENVFGETGKLLEKYNVENIHLTGGGGEYPLQDGFGWTNGVLIKLMDQYGVKE